MRASGLFRSELAVRALPVLTQAPAEGLSLRAVARALGTRDSSAQVALGTLLDSELILRGGTRGAGYVLSADHPLLPELLTIAFNSLPQNEVLALITRANQEVEFAAVDRTGLLLVFSNRSAASGRLRIKRALRYFKGAPALTSFLHDDVLEQLRDAPTVRERASRAKRLVGTLERSFPDRRRHGDFERARRLGKPHPSLALPSQRALKRMSRRFGLGQIGLFGSAVRSDFRPDSDVDVLIRPQPGRAMRSSELIGLEDELERAFERDVDIVTENELDARFRNRVLKDEVVLVG